MRKTKSLLITAILALATTYASATVVSATFETAGSNDPASASDLNTDTTNGTWATPTGDSGTEVNVQNGVLDYDYGVVGGTWTNQLNFTAPMALDGTTFELDINKLTRGNSGEAYLTVAGYDSADKELFKVLISNTTNYDSNNDNVSELFANLRYGVAYLGSDNIPVVLSDIEENRDLGYTYTLTLNATTFDFSATNTVPLTRTASAIAYNGTGAVNLSYIKLIAHRGDSTGGSNPPVGVEVNDITITGNDYVAPNGSSATNDTADAVYYTPLTVAAPGVLSNDTLTGTDKLDISVTLTGDKGGSLVLAADGSYVYTQAPLTQVGAEVFTYEVVDQAGSSLSPAVTATITVTTAAKVGNTLVADTYHYVPNTPDFTANVSSNDTIVYPDTVDVIVAGTTTNSGTVNLATDGSFTYSNPGYVGSDSFTYTVAGSAPVTVTISNVYTPSAVAGNALSLTSGSSAIGFNHQDLVAEPTGFAVGIADRTTGHWTCEFWIYLETAPAVNTLITESVSNRMNIGVEPNLGIYMENSGNGRTTNASLALKSWTHVAIIGFETGNGEIYINGVSTGTTSGPINNSFRMATLNPGNALGALGAKIDEFRVWTSARTGAEILATMNGTIDAPYSSDLGLYYNCDDLIAATRATSGKLDELTGIVDETSNTADSVNADNAILTSNAPMTTVLTPAFGITVSQEGATLSWSVEDEVGIKQYNITVDGVTTVVMFNADVNGSYSIILDSDAPATITIVDNSGFKQTFLPSDGNIVKAVYDLQEGWNLIAMPGRNADTSAIDSAFWGWNGSAYELVETVEVGKAVWVYSSVAKQIVVSAEKVSAELTLESGWNMVGPTENMKIPADAHTVYGWNETYQNIAIEDGILLQGIGYWIFKSN